MPMTRRQLHQTEIDYQDFLPRHSHVVSVRESPDALPYTPCHICKCTGREKKLIRYVYPVGGNPTNGTWKTHHLVACRQGRACRKRAYEQKASPSRLHRAA